jgi:hypothetical protein
MPTASPKLPPAPGPDVPIGWVDPSRKDPQGRAAILLNPDWFLWIKAAEKTLTIVRSEIP